MPDQVVSTPSSDITTSLAADQARRKSFRRLIPFLFVLYIIAYLDRANVAFAKIPMSADLSFSEAVFGLGAGIFYAGYILLEIPGALIVGAMECQDLDGANPGHLGNLYGAGWFCAHG
jgi:ACS family tartrate transporter-like MFS transporter